MTKNKNQKKDLPPPTTMPIIPILSKKLTEQLEIIMVKGESIKEVIQRLIDIYHYPEAPEHANYPRTPLHYKDHINFYSSFYKRSEFISEKSYKRSLQNKINSIKNENAKLTIQQFKKEKVK